MKIIFWLCLLGSLIACSEKKTTAEGGALNPDRIPDHLSKEKPEGQKLTGAQMDRLRTLLQKTSLLPDAALFLPPQNETPNQKTLRQTKIDNLSQPTKLVYQLILSNCPPDNKKANSGDFAKGKTQAWNFIESAKGTNCPVEVLRERRQTISWAQIDNVGSDTSATGVLEAAQKSFYTITNAELAKSSTISKIISRSASRGTIKIENKKITNYILSQGVRTVVVIDEGPVNATSQSQLLEVSEANKFTREEITDLKIKVKNFNFQLYHYIKHNDGAIAEESMYINGESVVAEDFADFLKGTN